MHAMDDGRGRAGQVIRVSFFLKFSSNTIVSLFFFPVLCFEIKNFLDRFPGMSDITFYFSLKSRKPGPFLNVVLAKHGLSWFLMF